MLEPVTANWRGTVGLGFTADEFDDYIATLGSAPRWVKGITLHNTGAPTLEGWHLQPVAPSYEARVKQRLKNIAHGYRTRKRPWNAGPHLFVDDRKIWVFTPLDQFGIHSPSWNKTKWGIEAVGDWEKDEPPVVLVDNVVAAIAVLNEWAGLPADTLSLHKEDRATDHDCPGDKLERQKTSIITKIIAAMHADGGEHALDQEIEEPKVQEFVTVVPGDTLFGIARRHGLKVGDLVAANGGTIIVPGQQIRLQPDVEEEAVVVPPPIPVPIGIVKQRISEKMEAWTIQKEGLALVRYKDSGGIWHIGVGEKIPEGEPQTLSSKAEAIARFRLKMAEFEGYVNKMVTVPLSQSQFDALAGGLVYNIGPTMFGKSSVLKALNVGNYTGAREAFMNFHRAGGKAHVLDGRRRAEQGVWDGDYGDVSKIPVYYTAVEGKLGKPVMELYPEKENEDV